MAVKLRLFRIGAKKSPFYRIIAIDSRSRRNGLPIEVIGTYDATKDPAIIKLDEKAALKWLNEGAKPTDTVRTILSDHGVMKQYAEAKLHK